MDGACIAATSAIVLSCALFHHLLDSIGELCLLPGHRGEGFRGRLLCAQRRCGHGDHGDPSLRLPLHRLH